MKVTFPHLGDLYLCAALIFKELEIPYVIPEKNSRETLDAGIAVSPEEICLPFKLMAGNLMDAAGRGAKKAIMMATMGPCRLGEYADLLKGILEKEGYDYHWVLLDSVKSIGKREFLRRVASIAENSQRGVSKVNGLWVLIKAARFICALDKTKAGAAKTAGYAYNPDHIIIPLRELEKDIEKADSFCQAMKLIRECDWQLEKVALDKEKSPVKVILTGEIYTLIEPYANRNIEEKLMRMGVCFSKGITLSWWLKNILPGRKNRKADKYMPHKIGGYAEETVAETVEAGEKGYDGVIKVMPVGCMPEIVAKSVCEEISEEEGIKVLNLIFDEMSADTGYMTRIEAFVDMLERKKGCSV